MAVSTEAFWRRGAWPAIGRRRPAPAPVLGVAAVLVGAELLSVLSGLAGDIFYGRGQAVTNYEGGRPSTAITIVRATAQVGPTDGLVLLAAALVLVTVRPGGLSRRLRQVRTGIIALTATLAVFDVAAVIAPFCELGSSAHFGFSPVSYFYFDDARMVLDRLAFAPMVGLTLAALSAEPLARRLTAGRIRRGEG